MIEKIQFEVDNSVNVLFPKNQEVRKHLKKKNSKLKEKLKKSGEKRNGRNSPTVQIMGIIHQKLTLHTKF